jgi:acyl carrier protein
MGMSTPNRDAERVTVADIREILVTHTGVASEAFDGREATPLEELGVDSLAILQLQASAAERFAVEIPDDALKMSVAGLAAFINERTGSGE